MIFLREVSIDDTNDIFEFASDPQVTKYLTWDHHKSSNDTIWAIKNIYLSKKEEHDLPNSFAIVYKETNKVIGIIDFYYDEFKRLTIGYFLNRNYWSKGIMTNALKMMIDKAFNELYADTLYISHDRENIGSKKVILKNNFKYFETQDTYYPFKDKFVTTDYYYLKRTDYK